jgi:hypothetical protein
MRDWRGPSELLTAKGSAVSTWSPRFIPSIAGQNYDSEALMSENTVVIAPATLPTEVTQTSAIRASSSAYSTKS